VAAEKKAPTLLTTIGSKPYEFLRSLAAPKAPKELKYDEVVKILKNLLVDFMSAEPSIG